MNWSSTYLGIPENECHCWELACRIYAGELGIQLPSYDGSLASAGEREEVEALVDGEMGGIRWRRVSEAEIRPFDILVFRRGRLRSHIGVAIDRRQMIHMLGRSHLQRFTDRIWGPRLTGVYRHVEATVKVVAA